MIPLLSRLPKKDLDNQTCLLRIDLNTASNEEKNSFRLEAILPTIEYLIKAGARVIILSHRGRPRPNAERFRPDKKLSLAPFAKVLSKKLKTKVIFAPSLQHLQQLKQLQPLTLLENLRFDPREETNDDNFAKELASLGDLYVNDAFAVSQRANASVVAITKFLPSFLGFLFEKELNALNHVMDNASRPLTLILGGIKIKDKSGVIKCFKNRADSILLGGGLANTFLKARGEDIKNSVVDDIADIKEYLLYDNIILPEDVVFHQKRILDIGPKTIKKFETIISHSNTVIWNGPMGLFEDGRFKKGTDSIWRAILKLSESNNKSFSLVGGGETTSSLNLITNYRLLITKNKNIFVSTGGGAMLEYLSGKELSGIEALKKVDKKLSVA